jgi:thioredoxin 2
MAPEFERAAKDLEPDFQLAQINTEAEQAVGTRLGIRAIPTLILFRNGQEAARQSGAIRRQAIVAWARSH